MRYSSTSLLFALVAFTSFARGAQHLVTVGGPGALSFDPQFIEAEVGDTILFTFKRNNHTVTQSSFDSPCVAKEAGFTTGFIPVAADNTDGPFPAAEYTVTDLNPVWTFCAQANHCTQGMVFAVNPGNRFDAFKATAMGTTAPQLSTSSSNPAPSLLSEAGSSSTAPATTFSGPTVTSASFPPVLPSLSASATSSSSSVESSVVSISKDHRVVVGGPRNDQLFQPSHIRADVGDTITFEFHQTNHTVTASSFSQPCIPLSKTMPNNPFSFDSGFMFVRNGVSKFPTYTIQVNNSMPIWAFCAQKAHCGARMVFAANSDENGGALSFASFSAKAEHLNGTVAVAAAANSDMGLRDNIGFGFVIIFTSTVFTVLFSL